MEAISFEACIDVQRKFILEFASVAFAEPARLCISLLFQNGSERLVRLREIKNNSRGGFDWAAVQSWRLITPFLCGSHGCLFQ